MLYNSTALKDFIMEYNQYRETKGFLGVIRRSLLAVMLPTSFRKVLDTTTLPLVGDSMVSFWRGYSESIGFFQRLIFSFFNKFSQKNQKELKAITNLNQYGLLTQENLKKHALAGKGQLDRVSDFSYVMRKLENDTLFDNGDRYFKFEAREDIKQPIVANLILNIAYAEKRYPYRLQVWRFAETLNDFKRHGLFDKENHATLKLITNTLMGLSHDEIETLRSCPHIMHDFLVPFHKIVIELRKLEMKNYSLDWKELLPAVISMENLYYLIESYPCELNRIASEGYLDGFKLKFIKALSNSINHIDWGRLRATLSWCSGFFNSLAQALEEGDLILEHFINYILEQETRVQSSIIYLQVLKKLVEIGLIHDLASLNLWIESSFFKELDEYCIRDEVFVEVLLDHIQNAGRSPEELMNQGNIKAIKSSVVQVKQDIEREKREIEQRSTLESLVKASFFAFQGKIPSAEPESPVHTHQP